MSYIALKQVAKVYQTSREVSVTAVSDVSFTIDQGEFTVILGPSGAGKTTILNLLGGMDTATAGSVQVAGQDLTQFSKHAMAAYRRNDVGFVFQFYNLVPNLTALENVNLATEVCRAPLDAQTVLADVGLAARQHNFPSQLSGGEQQRVAIARALAKNPKILLCDEPTGALDSTTGKSVMQVLKQVAHKMGQTLIVVTHNAELAKAADKVVRMHNGGVKTVTTQTQPVPLEALQW